MIILLCPNDLNTRRHRCSTGSQSSLPVCNTVDRNEMKLWLTKLNNLSSELERNRENSKAHNGKTSIVFDAINFLNFSLLLENNRVVTNNKKFLYDVTIVGKTVKELQ